MYIFSIKMLGGKESIFLHSPPKLLELWTDENHKIIEPEFHGVMK